MPHSKFSFSSMSLSDWYSDLKSKVQIYQMPTRDPKAVSTISKFYTQTLDYLLNPKNEIKNSEMTYAGFLDGNIF